MLRQRSPIEKLSRLRGPNGVGGKQLATDGSDAPPLALKITLATVLAALAGFYVYRDATKPSLPSRGNGVAHTQVS